MRARTDPDIVLIAPIGEVVPAFGAWPGVIGDLVSRQPVSGEAVLRHLEQYDRDFLLGQHEFAEPHRGGEGGAGLDRQLVEREVLASESQRFVELALPGRDALARAGIDQIEREARKDLARMLDRGDCLVTAVAPAQQAQRRWIER